MKNETCECPACGNILCDKQSLGGHMSFMRKQGDVVHIEYCNKVGVNKCPVCDWGFKRRSDVGNHIFGQSKNDEEHKAFYNEQIGLISNLFNQGQMIGQILKNKGVFFSRAWICDYLKETRSNIQCPICSGTFRDKTGLTSHLGKQENEEHQRYLKEIGNKEYQRYQSKERQCPVPGCDHKSVWLDRHMRMKIEQGNEDHIKYRDKHYNHICPVCNNCFKSSQALMGHIHNLVKNTDVPHKAFIENQKQKMINYFEAGLCIDEIMKQPDIIYSFADGIYPIVHANFSEDEIYQRGRDKTGEKNKALIASDPAAFFGRMEQARTQGSRAQKLCAHLLQERLSEYKIKELDQDIFPGKEIDITIPELKVAIEWQGPPHHRPIFGEKSLKGLQKSDKAKRTYFKRIGWRLIEIVDNSNSGFNEKFVQEQVNKIIEIV